LVAGVVPDIFIWGGALEGPVLQQGELSMVCVGLSERDLKKFGGAMGPPWHPPSSAPGWLPHQIFARGKINNVKD